MNNNLRTDLAKAKRPLAKLAYAEEFAGDTSLRTAAYSNVREEQSTGITHKLPAEVEFCKRSKGVGSAKSGSNHWLHQRITAIILAICSIWLIFFIKCNIGKDLTHFVGTLQKPYNIVPLGILVITSFYHSMLGMQVVIEDYISCIKLRIGLIIFLQIFCIITIGCLVVALFYAII